MRKILISLAVIAVAGAVAIGATTAYFSDTENSTGNTFTAGTLDLKVGGQDVIPIINIGNLKPGDSGSYAIDVSNTGSVTGNHLMLKIVDLVDSDMDNPLSDRINIIISEAGIPIHTGTLAGLATAIDLGALNGGAVRNLTFSYSIPTTVGNEIQGDTTTFGIETTLYQEI